MDNPDYLITESELKALIALLAIPGVDHVQIVKELELLPLAKVWYHSKD